METTRQLTDTHNLNLARQFSQQYGVRPPLSFGLSDSLIPDMQDIAGARNEPDEVSIHLISCTNHS